MQIDAGVRVDTGAGVAEIEFDRADRPRFLLVLTHGSGGGVEARDLLTVRDVALAEGGTVARVVQPYRVAGRRAPGSTAAQDAAWLDIIAALRGEGDLPLIIGGRSNGARLACRTAAEVSANGVVALSFPLHPPGRPERTRVDELRAAEHVIVINGERDPFGIPEPADAEEVHVIPGQPHAFRAGFDAIAAATRGWLRRTL